MKNKKSITIDLERDSTINQDIAAVADYRKKQA
jgi:hypothetical protein